MSVSSTATQMSKYQQQVVDGWTREKKLEKISQYSACQVDTCKCNGFKSSTNTNDNNNNNSEQESATSSCKFCSHLLSKHFVVVVFLTFNLLVNCYLKNGIKATTQKPT